MSNAGNRGKDVRSDCYIEFEPRDNGGIELEINSKVNVLYGDTIDSLLTEILNHFEIDHARVYIEDSGALEYVIAARLEAAIKKEIQTRKEYLPALVGIKATGTERLKRRFSRLYLPGNTPRFFINAAIHKPDAIILDLEDSVAPEKKYEARFLVRNALRAVDFIDAERMVRINQLPLAFDDLDMLVPQHPDLILIPKCESVEQIEAVDTKINALLDNSIPRNIWLMPIIESALGVMHAYEIAGASVYNAALAIGLEDYCADMGVRRTNQGQESFYARSQVSNAAKATGIQAIDSVFSDIDDMDALRNTIAESKGLGFEGMGCIHPRQIPVIHEAYAPDRAEIERAQKIVDAFHEATEKGLHVVSIGSKMIDPPVVKRALRILEIAQNLNIINIKNEDA
jgi:citrate lyase subunit beta / citryl-CoA lyase